MKNGEKVNALNFKL